MPHVNELHEQHDPMLIVSLASGDLATADRDHATAQSLVAGCADCARLHDDVLAIASATKSLPSAARTRDFQISAEQAARLRPAGVRGVLARLTAPGGFFSRQLGVGLATLGVAGLLVGSLGSINVGSMAGAGAAPSMAASTAERAQAPAASPAAASPDPYAAFGGNAETAASRDPNHLDTAATPSPDTVRSATGAESAPSAAPPVTGLPQAGSPDRDEDKSLTATAPTDLTSTGGPSPLMIVSIALLVAGALVLVAQQISRAGRSR